MEEAMPKSTSRLLAAAALCAALALPALAQEGAARVGAGEMPLQKAIGQVTPTGPVPSLFVLNARGATLADGKLTLTGVSPDSIVFADRPVRAAGHIDTAQFVETWVEGEDRFDIDPPNATVSVLGGDAGVADAVVTISAPILEGDDLVFTAVVLEGALAGAAGPAALFIDRGGFGGLRQPGRRLRSAQHIQLRRWHLPRRLGRRRRRAGGRRRDRCRDRQPQQRLRLSLLRISALSALQLRSRQCP
jgi:hypothetical protein